MWVRVSQQQHAAVATAAAASCSSMHPPGVAQLAPGSTHRAGSIHLLWHELRVHLKPQPATGQHAPAALPINQKQGSAHLLQHQPHLAQHIKGSMCPQGSTHLARPVRNCMYDLALGSRAAPTYPRQSSTHLLRQELSVHLGAVKQRLQLAELGLVQRSLLLLHSHMGRWWGCSARGGKAGMSAQSARPLHARPLQRP